MYVPESINFIFCIYYRRTMKCVLSYSWFTLYLLRASALMQCIAYIPKEYEPH